MTTTPLVSTISLDTPIPLRYDDKRIRKYEIMKKLGTQLRRDKRMPLVKVGARHQVTIPKEIVERVKLKAGDYVEVTLLEDDRIVIVPKAIVDRDLWYWSEEGQREIKESLADQKVGRVKRFKNVEALIKELNR